MRLPLVGAVAAALLACPGGGNSVCDRKVDLTAKVGNCSSVDTRPLLRDPSTCSTRLMQCNDTDKTTFSSSLDCLDKLPICDSSGQATWNMQLETCYAGLSALSLSCSASVYDGVLPGQDGGADGGHGGPDAGRQPIDDGGAGISLI